MTFTPVETQAQIEASRSLFNSCASAGETLFKAFGSAEAFSDFFLKRADAVETVCLSDGADGCLGSGCLSEDGKKGYITFVAVRKDLRRKGIATQLLRAIEEALQKMAGEKLGCYEATFFNPMNFVWTIPDTPGHEHPNAPGVDVAGSGYMFLKNTGYRDYAVQNAYYLNLKGYELTEAMSKKKEELKDRGITITTYDASVHTGLEELLNDLDNDLWYREITQTVADRNGAPVLIVDWNGRAMGFTGPMRVQENGRGYLAGVGVRSDCRGMGAGKVMFGELCVRLKELGAQYMTLFTGENNSARNIYEAQGFKIVRTWADMRKKVQSHEPDSLRP